MLPEPDVLSVKERPRMAGPSPRWICRPRALGFSWHRPCLSHAPSAGCRILRLNRIYMHMLQSVGPRYYYGPWVRPCSRLYTSTIRIMILIISTLDALQHNSRAPGPSSSPPAEHQVSVAWSCLFAASAAAAAAPSPSMLERLTTGLRDSFLPV